jgi:hypothetical protein
MEDINKMIEEDPLLALEKLLTGQVSISSIQVLLQELKTLMTHQQTLNILYLTKSLNRNLFLFFIN